MIAQIVFVTGTGTGSGKTVLTSLLLQHLRSRGVNALAMKPVCTGPRDDVDLLQSIQRNELSDDCINPFYYKVPAAPVVAARRYKGKVNLQGVLRSINRVKAHCDILLVEGAGGLMVPLNEQGHTWADLLKKLKCPTIVAALNELGIINSTLLTVGKLNSIGIKDVTVSLINFGKKGEKEIPERTNYGVLRKILNKTPIFEIPFIGSGSVKKAQIVQGSKKIEKILAQILNTV
tara:strand:+ start:1259 stop:1957 length:699 start_codon:yes stop_codon:yes gene_type:complete